MGKPSSLSLKLAPVTNCREVYFGNPATTFTISAEVVMPLGLPGSVYLGFSSSQALSVNLPLSGALWISLDGMGNWQMRANGSVIQGFVSILIQGGSPGVGYCAYDMNRDGAVDDADLSSRSSPHCSGREA